MRLIIFLCALLLTPTVVYADDQSDELDRPQDHGYSEKDTKNEIKKKRKQIDVERIAQDIATSFEAQDQFASAQYTDEAIENLIMGTVAVLKQYGHTKEADDIEIEYMLKHRYSITKALANKAMGDHAVLSEFIKVVHEKAHELLGDFICHMTRIHDLWTLNYAIPVMFAPTKFDQEEFKTHFHGKRFAWFMWQNRGGVPIITYHVVNGICGGLTSGLGWITFICGPISGMGQTVMENYFSEDLSDLVWERFNK